MRSRIYQCREFAVHFAKLVSASQDRRHSVVIFRKRVAGLNRSSLERFVSRARRALRLRSPVNVLVTSSREVRTLNRGFRKIDRPTDVLSFPSGALPKNHLPRIAGEIVLSADIARQSAARLGHPVASEIKILVLHGLLHIAGYDHERDNGRMAALEKRLRLQLKLEPGLIERTQVRTKSFTERRRPA
jgi:probable rRNA maturation factor